MTTRENDEPLTPAPALGWMGAGFDSVPKP